MNLVHVIPTLRFTLCMLILFGARGLEIQALTMQAYSTQNLWSEADLICMGLIKEVHFKRTNGRMITSYTLEVKQIYKSTVGQKYMTKISLILPGGQDGQYRQYVPGYPYLKKDTPYLV